MWPKESICSKQSREIWRKLDSRLNESYKADEMARLNKQMEELKLADSKGDYTTTWKMIHDLPEKDRNPKVKVKMRDGAPPKSDKDLLVEWQEFFSSLLNNDNGQTLSDLPLLAAQDLPIHDHPPTIEETLEAICQMKTMPTRQQYLTALLPQNLSRVAVMQWQMLSIASVLKCIKSDTT